MVGSWFWTVVSVDSFADYDFQRSILFDSFSFEDILHKVPRLFADLRWSVGYCGGAWSQF